MTEIAAKISTRVLATALTFAMLTALALSGSSHEAVAEQKSNSLDSDSASVLTDEDIHNLRDEMESRGISDEDQEGILDKIQRGELPDSDNPEVEPVQSYNSPEDDEVEVLIFPDGSVAYTSIGSETELNNTGKIQARAVVGSEQCRKYWYNSGWERWDSCLIQYDGLAFKYSFRANVSLPHNASGRAIIRDVWEPTIWRAVGHTVQSKSVSIIQSWENKQNRTPARAQMRSTLQVAKIFSTKTIALDLEIRGRGVRIIPTM